MEKQLLRTKLCKTDDNIEIKHYYNSRHLRHLRSLLEKTQHLRISCKNADI